MKHEIMTLPTTEQEFKEMVWSKSKNHLDQYPVWFQKEFVDYWLTVPDLATKCRYFLLPKKDREKWSTLGRMATCKRMLYRNDPRWKSEPTGAATATTAPKLYPGTFHVRKTEDPGIDYEAYAKRMEKENQTRQGNIGSILKQNLYGK